MYWTRQDCYSSWLKSSPTSILLKPITFASRFSAKKTLSKIHQFNPNPWCITLLHRHHRCSVERHYQHTRTEAHHHQPKTQTRPIWRAKSNLKEGVWRRPYHPNSVKVHQWLKNKTEKPADSPIIQIQPRSKLTQKLKSQQLPISPSSVKVHPNN